MHLSMELFDISDGRVCQDTYREETMGLWIGNEEARRTRQN